MHQVSGAVARGQPCPTSKGPKVPLQAPLAAKSGGGFQGSAKGRHKRGFLEGSGRWEGNVSGCPGPAVYSGPAEQCCSRKNQPPPTTDPAGGAVHPPPQPRPQGG